MLVCCVFCKNLLVCFDVLLLNFLIVFLVFVLWTVFLCSADISVYLPNFFCLHLFIANIESIAVTAWLPFKSVGPNVYNPLYSFNCLKFPVCKTKLKKELHLVLSFRESFPPLQVKPSSGGLAGSKNLPLESITASKAPCTFFTWMHHLKPST